MSRRDVQMNFPGIDGVENRIGGTRLSAYEPGHHPDAASYRAVNQGVVSHHWSFGNMPPVPGVSQRSVGQIVAYVRELQRANGIR